MIARYWHNTGKRVLMLVPVFLFFVQGLQANPGQLFKEAGELYKSGKYRESVILYDSLYKMNLESAELCYNLGNAWFKLQEIPRAILWYERASRLDPSDADIRYNLEMTRSMVVDKLETLPPFFLSEIVGMLRDSLSSDAWARLGLFLLITGLVMLLLFLFSSKAGLRKVLFYFAVCLLLFSVGSVALSLNRKKTLEARTDAVIMTPSVTLKSSPDQNGTDLFILHEGTCVMIEDKVGEWLEVKISDGNKGWLVGSSLEII